MKRLYIALVALSSCCLSACEKNTQPTDPTFVAGLPPATQYGANTFGCLVNGVPWVPAGSNGTPNLSIDYDPGFNNGIFNIVAYRFTSFSSEQLLVAVGDSLNFLAAPLILPLSKNSLYSISFKRNCHWFNQFSDIFSSGTLTLKKFDKSQRIISGEFNAIMHKPGCDTVKITNGRFDFKF